MLPRAPIAARGGAASSSSLAAAAPRPAAPVRRLRLRAVGNINDVGGGEQGGVVENLSPAAAVAAATAAAAPKKPSPQRWVSDALSSTPITLLGDDHALNCAVAAELGKRIGWFASPTHKVLCGILKVASVEEALATKGAAEVGALRAAPLPWFFAPRPLPRPLHSPSIRPFALTSD